LAKYRAILLALGLPLASSCGGGGEADPSASPSATAGQCSSSGQIAFVRTTLREIYFWYQELPDPAPSGFSSPEAYLEAVRYRPLDTTFSYIANQAESDAFFSESQFVGIGLSSQQVSATEVRVAQTFPGSPAADAGIARGDYLTAINGRPIEELIRTGDINTIFGANQIGVVVRLSWRTPDGVVADASLTKRAVTIPTVSDVRVFDVRGRRVGYVFFRNFVQPSTAALNQAFTTLGEAGVDELVLDLRYNGGGLVSVAQHLGGLIGGDATRGQVFGEFFHNDKNTARNTTFRFERPAAAIGFSRLVVITTGGSASASEAVINGMRPFMPVTVVGDTTFGKPVGQYGYDFCDKTIFPVSFVLRNALGQSDFYDGIPADCAAADDLDHPIGDSSEASLQEALSFIRTGSCSGTAAVAARANARRAGSIGRRPPGDGWQQLLLAH
jgi:C-terminal peptidase prc